MNRKSLTKLVTFLGGIYFFVEFVLPAEVVTKLRFDRFHEQITNGFIVISAMAVGLGLFNLLQIHGLRLAFLRKGWLNSLGLLLGLAVMLGITVNDWLTKEDLAAQSESVARLAEFSMRIKKDVEDRTLGVPTLTFRNEKLAQAAQEQLGRSTAVLAQGLVALISSADPNIGLARIAERDLKASLEKVTAKIPLLSNIESAATPDLIPNQELADALKELSVTQRKFLLLRYEYSTSNNLYEFFYSGLFVSLSSAMFALLGFYIASAAYRAFRVKSAESALMLGAAVLVMLGQIPFGVWVWSDLPAVRLWLLQIPSSAAFRAIAIGASVAGLIMALRMWLSIESESFSTKER